MANRHEAQCWFIGGPTSQTVDHQWTNTGPRVSFGWKNSYHSDSGGCKEPNRANVVLYHRWRTSFWTEGLTSGDMSCFGLARNGSSYYLQCLHRVRIKLDLIMFSTVESVLWGGGDSQATPAASPLNFRSVNNVVILAVNSWISE